MMFQLAKESNGEGLENGVFTCMFLYSELAEQSGLIDRAKWDVE